MTSVLDIELLESVYTFLMSNGHEVTAKSLAKEAKLDEKKLKNPAASNSEDDDSSDDDVPPAKRATSSKFTVAPATEGSDDDSSEEEAPVIKSAPAKKAVAAESSDDDSSDEGSSEEEAPLTKSAPSKKAVAAESSDDDSSDEGSSEEEAPVTKSAPSKKAVAAESSDDDSSDDDSSDEGSSEEEAPVTKSAPTKNSGLTNTKAAATASAPTGTSIKVYVKGLPWLATEDEVTDFFISCGEISRVEMIMGDDGRATGTAFVHFSQRSELEKALELDGQFWQGTERWLKVQEGFEKVVRKTFSSSGKPAGCDTVFVGNLPFDVEEDQLIELFTAAGTVEKVRFGMAEDGSFRGFAHIQFSEEDSTEAALAMAGTNIGGRDIRVDYAPNKERQPSFGGGSAGKGRGDGGRGGRGGGGRGTPGRSKGSAAVSSGKKMTFDA